MTSSLPPGLTAIADANISTRQLVVNADGSVNIQDQIRAWITAGQGFTATTGKLTAAGAITGGFGIFNPNASGKTLLLYALSMTIGNNSFNEIRIQTADPAFGASITPVNNLIGSVAASVASVSSANTNQTAAGTIIDVVGGATNTPLSVFQNGRMFLIPANKGLAIYPNISGANSWVVTASWLEI